MAKMIFSWTIIILFAVVLIADFMKAIAIIPMVIIPMTAAIANNALSSCMMCGIHWPESPSVPNMYGLHLHYAPPCP